jgi:hypothetical protein
MGGVPEKALWCCRVQGRGVMPPNDQACVLCASIQPMPRMLRSSLLISTSCTMLCAFNHGYQQRVLVLARSLCSALDLTALLLVMVVMCFPCSGTNFEIDTLYVLLPNNTCITRGLALNRSSSSTLDFVSFFIKYFSYDLPGIEGEHQVLFTRLTWHGM